MKPEPETTRIGESGRSASFAHARPLSARRSRSRRWSRSTWASAARRLSFAAPEKDYFRARYEGLGGKPEPALTEPAQAIFDRLEKSFARILPLTGQHGNPPQLSLWRWGPDGQQRQVNDPREVQRMARQLKNAWLAANGSEVAPGRSVGKQPELTPRQIEELRALGYVAGGG